MFCIYTDTISLTFYMIPYNDCIMQPKHIMNNLSAVVCNRQFIPILIILLPYLVGRVEARNPTCVD